MEPAEALVAAETALREAVRILLPDWLDGVGAPDADQLIRKRDEDQRRRDGTVVSDDLLNYTELHQVANIITRNWESFKPAFDDLARTKVWLGALMDLRNSVAHGRSLVTFERDLLSGVSGQIRNQVALLRTAHEPSTAYYPVIEEVSDSFGQRFEASWSFDRPSGGAPIRLNVGDRITLSMRAWDARGRDLEWDVFVDIGRAGPRYDEVPLIRLYGSTADCMLQIQRDWVSEAVTVTVRMRGPGEFHRRSHTAEPAHDDEVTMGYRVNPPLG